MDIRQEEQINIVEIQDKQMILLGLDYIHCEVKRVEKLNIDEAMEQALRDSKGDNIPAVFHRKNNKKWKVTMYLDDFMKLYNEYYSGRKLEER